MVSEEGSGSGGQNWTDQSLYQQNSGWIATTSAPQVDFQYATGLPEAQRAFQLPNASADSGLAPLPRAGAPVAYPSFDQSQSYNLDDEYQGNQYAWPSVPAPLPFGVSLAQPLQNSALIKNVPDPYGRPPIGSVGLTPDPRTQPAYGDFARPQPVVSSPLAGEAGTVFSTAAANLARPHSIAQETPSTAPTRQAAPKTISTKSLSPTSAQTSPTRKRKGGTRSPLARQPLPKAPFQPNEEEEARRIHMASAPRGGSLMSSATGSIRGGDEPESAGTEGNLRVAEIKMLENLGAGRTPGVLRTPQSGDDQNEQFSLPPGKGFPIQIGSELFRLSGASIMSDCKSPDPLF